MNVVMDEAAEVFVKDAKPRRELGMFRILRLQSRLIILSMP
jgi:hypothetical protein